MFIMKDRTVLITGSTGGIGNALAEKFCETGCIVGLHSTSIDKLDKFVDSLIEKGIAANKIHKFVANLADNESVKQLAKDALEKMGSVDVLLNNAGITKDGLFIRMSDSDFQSVLQINLVSACLLARELSVAMLKQRFGRIINISSVVATIGNPGQANYCAAKAGMIGFSKALAKELASKNVTVNCISPGFIESAMTDALNEKQKETILSSIPMRRMGKSAEIAAAAIYLASDEAAYITGQTLHVNGGMAMV